MYKGQVIGFSNLKTRRLSFVLGPAAMNALAVDPSLAPAFDLPHYIAHASVICGRRVLKPEVVAYFLVRNIAPTAAE